MNWPPQYLHRYLVAITLMLLLTAIGCSNSGKVPKPSSDSTPPTLRWNVYNLDSRTSQDISGSSTLTVQTGENYRVTLFAEDPQGIHKISLGSSTFWQCISGDIGQNHGPSLGVADIQELQPDGQNNVLTSIFLIKNATIGPFDCQSGYTFNGGDVTFSGTGENYYSGTTQAQLVLQLLP